MELSKFSLDTSFFEEIKKTDPKVTYDLLILGGGPAAMSAAVYAARKMLNLAVITKDFGGQVRETSLIENWLGFQSISSKELADMFEEHAKSFEISVSIGPTVMEVKKEAEIFNIYTDNGMKYFGNSIILATGKRHRSLNVPGEKELVGRGLAYCATCDAPFFKEKRVVVAGGGNSAFTTAIDLLKVGAQVILVNFIKGWQADKALLEKVKNSGSAGFLDYHQIVRIEGDDKVKGVIVRGRESEKEEKLECDGVFVEIGLLPNSEPVKRLVGLNEQNEVIIDCFCRTSVEGVFGAGDVTNVPHKQIVIAAGEGAKAALSAYDYLISNSLI